MSGSTSSATIEKQEPRLQATDNTLWDKDSGWSLLREERVTHWVLIQIVHGSHFNCQPSK